MALFIKIMRHCSSHHWVHQGQKKEEDLLKYCILHFIRDERILGELPVTRCSRGQLLFPHHFWHFYWESQAAIVIKVTRQHQWNCHCHPWTWHWHCHQFINGHNNSMLRSIVQFYLYQYVLYIKNWKIPKNINFPHHILTILQIFQFRLNYLRTSQLTPYVGN